MLRLPSGEMVVGPSTPSRPYAPPREKILKHFAKYSQVPVVRVCCPRGLVAAGPNQSGMWILPQDQVQIREAYELAQRL